MRFRDVIGILPIVLAFGCSQESDTSTNISIAVKEQDQGECDAPKVVDADQEVLEFERQAKELPGMSRGGECYESIVDDKNRVLRNRHLELRICARDRLVRGIAAGTPISDHWHLMCRWYEIMKDESNRLNFNGEIFNTEAEIQFAERQMAMGMLIERYSESDVIEIINMIVPFLGQDIKPVAEIKKEYGIK